MNEIILLLFCSIVSQSIGLLSMINRIKKGNGIYDIKAGITCIIIGLVIQLFIIIIQVSFLYFTKEMRSHLS